MANKKQKPTQKIKKTYLDTSLYIYVLNNDSDFFITASNIFNYCESNEILIHASTITLTELLQSPKIQRDTNLKSITKSTFLSTPNIHIIDIDLTIAEYSATLAATYNIRIPDSIHLATAILSSCDTFVTNDKKLQRVKEINCVLMDKF